MSDFVQDFFTSRQNYPDGNVRIGQEGRLWYDSITNTIRISDGITPGGIIVSGGGTGISGYSGYSGISGWSGFSGSGVNPWIRVTSNYTASSGDRIIADTSGGAFTVDLPAGPSLGSYIQILDAGNNNLTIGANGSTIEGLPSDLVLNNPGGMYEFIYDGTTWQVVEPGGGASGYSGAAGESGYSGAAGSAGQSGFSGYSGVGLSGYSGLGLSGYSGYRGQSGYSGLSGALSPWTLITSNYTAVNGDRLIADTSGGQFTIYLPAAPVTGDYIQITDGWNLGLINCIVDPNGSTVEGYTDNVALDLSHVTYEFIYNGSTWEVTGTTGARGQSGYSGALDPWKLITGTYFAANGNRLIADTSGGQFTVYLPAYAVTGDYIQITDGWNLAINNCIVDPNGGNVEGYTDNVALDLSHVTYEFIYNGSTWEVTGTTGARGQSGYSGLGLSGYSGLNAFVSASNSIVAGTDLQGQGVLTYDINVVVTTGSNPSGVTLPTAIVSKTIIVINRGTAAINVYPNVGASIDGYGINQPLQIPVNGFMEFVAVSNTQWYSSGNNTITGGPRVVYVADGGTITPNIDISDVVIQQNTQVGGVLNISAPTGVAASCQQFVLYVQTTNIQSLSFDVIYGGSVDLSLPTATTGGSSWDYMTFMYNSIVGKWQLITKNFGFS